MAGRLADRDDVRRLHELADELTADQRLVLACRVALDMDCQEFCARFGWSAEKFRKVAQRGRARLRSLVADYEAGERCKRLADDLAAYVAHVAHAEQSERVRRHLTNCPACAHTARELDRVVGALLPLPSTVDPEVVHRLGLVGRVLGRLLPFWDSGEGVAAAKACAAGAAGGGAVTAGSSVLGLGAAKLGVTAVCVAAATGGYVVCDQIGLFSGPLPRERHHLAATANVAHKSPKGRAPSPPVSRAPTPITHTIRQAAPPLLRAWSTAHPRRLGPRRVRPAASSASRAQGARRAPRQQGAQRLHRRVPRCERPAHARHRRRQRQRRPAHGTSGSGHSASTEFGFE